MDVLIPDYTEIRGYRRWFLPLVWCTRARAFPAWPFAALPGSPCPDSKFELARDKKKVFRRKERFASYPRSRSPLFSSKALEEFVNPPPSLARYFLGRIQHGRNATATRNKTNAKERGGSIRWRMTMALHGEGWKVGRTFGRMLAGSFAASFDYR